MKRLIIILCMLTGVAYGQGMPADSASGYIKYPYAKGIWYNDGAFTRRLNIPADTIYSKTDIANQSLLLTYAQNHLDAVGLMP